MYTKATMALDLCLGRGAKWNPYLSGLIIEGLRRKMRPKPFSVAPDDLYPKSGMKDCSFL